MGAAETSDPFDNVFGDDPLANLSEHQFTLALDRGNVDHGKNSFSDRSQVGQEEGRPQPRTLAIKSLPVPDRQTVVAVPADPVDTSWNEDPLEKLSLNHCGSALFLHGGSAEHRHASAMDSSRVGRAQPRRPPHDVHERGSVMEGPWDPLMGVPWNPSDDAWDDDPLEKLNVNCGRALLLDRGNADHRRTAVSDSSQVQRELLRSVRGSTLGRNCFAKSDENVSANKFQNLIPHSVARSQSVRANIVPAGQRSRSRSPPRHDGGKFPRLPRMQAREGPSRRTLRPNMRVPRFGQ